MFDLTDMSVENTEVTEMQEIELPAEVSEALSQNSLVES